MLLTIDLLFMSGIDSGIAFRFASERTTRARRALSVRTLRTGFSVTGKTGAGFSIACKTGTGFTFTDKAGTSRLLHSLSAETRPRAAFAFIVGIVVVHQFFEF
jgi:hypothetical protein